MAWGQPKKPHPLWGLLRKYIGGLKLKTKLTISKKLTFAVIIFAALGLITTVLALSPRPVQQAQATTHPFCPASWFCSGLDSPWWGIEGLSEHTKPDTDDVILIVASQNAAVRYAIVVMEGILTEYPQSYSDGIGGHFNMFHGWRNLFGHFAGHRGTSILISDILAFHDLDPNGRYTILAVNSGDGGTGVRWIEGMVHVNAHIIDLPPRPEIPGFNFMGWYFDEAFTEAYDGRTITQDTVLHARFEAVVYSVTYILNGGELPEGAPTTFTIEDETVILPAPTRAGHYFRGWYTNPALSGEAVTIIPAGSMGDMSFYARWEIQRFTVTFMVRGIPYTSMVVEWGTVLGAKTFVDPMTGQLARLYSDEGLRDIFAFDDYGITYDTVIFTDSSVHIFVALTYNVMGDTTTHLMPHGERLGLIMAVERPGFIFEGWYFDSEFTRPVQANDRLTSNTTIYARFTPIAIPAYENTSFWSVYGGHFIGGGAVVIVIGAIVGIGLIVKKVKGRA